MGKPLWMSEWTGIRYGFHRHRWQNCFKKTGLSSDGILINNIYREHELERETTCANFAHTKNYGRREGFTQTKNVVLYNLDVIISVGYRVKSQ